MREFCHFCGGKWWFCPFWVRSTQIPEGGVLKWLCLSDYSVHTRPHPTSSWGELGEQYMPLNYISKTIHPILLKSPQNEHPYVLNNHLNIIISIHPLQEFGLIWSKKGKITILFHKNDKTHASDTNTLPQKLYLS